MSAPLFARSLAAGVLILVPLATGPFPEDAAPLRAVPVPEAAAGTEAAASAPASDAPAPGRIAEWVSTSGDNEGLPFVVVDETYGQIYVFDSRGELQALGQIAPGKGSVERILADNRVVVYVLPEESAAGHSPDYIRYAARHP